MGLGGGYDWAHLAFQLPSHLNQSTCKIWKQSYKDIFGGYNKGSLI